MEKWKFVRGVQVTGPRCPPCPHKVKTLQKSSSPEPVGWLSWNLVCSFGDLSQSLFVQMMTLGWPRPILGQGQICSHRLLYGQKSKPCIFSSPEQKLRVSYCDHTLSVVRHQSSVVRRQQLVLLTLQRSQFWPNLDETCPEYLPLWNLGQVWYWVTWGKKLGHQVKSKEKLVNTLEVTFLKQSIWILLKMFVLMISRSSSKLGHLGWKTRSPGHIK